MEGRNMHASRYRVKPDLGNTSLSKSSTPKYIFSSLSFSIVEGMVDTAPYENPENCQPSPSL
jgi:hypothetical protein